MVGLERQLARRMQLRAVVDSYSWQWGGQSSDKERGGAGLLCGSKQGPGDQAPSMALLYREPRARDRLLVVGVQFHRAPLTGLGECAGEFYLLVIGIQLPLTPEKRRGACDMTVLAGTS